MIRDDIKYTALKKARECMKAQRDNARKRCNEYENLTDLIIDIASQTDLAEHVSRRIFNCFNCALLWNNGSRFGCHVNTGDDYISDDMIKTYMNEICNEFILKKPKGI